MAGIEQINVGYNPEEDRLLLRMTSRTGEGMAEYRLWLTRRFVMLMWQGLDQSLEADAAANPEIEPTAREAVRQFQEEAAISNADFKTPYQPEVALTPLGENPVLVARLRISSTQNGNKILTLNNSRDQGVNLTLTPAMVHSFRKLIAQSAEKAGWNLDLKLASAMTEGEGGPVIIQ